jgi:hypothetical protein
MDVNQLENKRDSLGSSEKGKNSANLNASLNLNSYLHPAFFSSFFAFIGFTLVLDQDRQ